MFHYFPFFSSMLEKYSRHERSTNFASVLKRKYLPKPLRGVIKLTFIKKKKKKLSLLLCMSWLNYLTCEYCMCIEPQFIVYIHTQSDAQKIASSELLIHVCDRTFRNRLHDGCMKAMSLPGTCAYSPVICSRMELPRKLENWEVHHCLIQAKSVC